MQLARSNCQNQPFAVQKARSPQEAVRGVSGLMPLAPGTSWGVRPARGTRVHGSSYRFRKTERRLVSPRPRPHRLRLPPSRFLSSASRLRPRSRSFHPPRAPLQLTALPLRVVTVSVVFIQDRDPIPQTPVPLLIHARLTRRPAISVLNSASVLFTRFACSTMFQICSTRRRSTRPHDVGGAPAQDLGRGGKLHW